jgi:Fe-S-cluster containining protein
MAIEIAEHRGSASAQTSSPRFEPFGYECHRCSHCCYHKGIQVNPYEVARLARKLDQTTTDFRMAWTRESAGTMLKQTDTGACVFLGENGCTVHLDRPLVCRLYPLGRHIGADGAESFSHLEPHPLSAGQVTADGTIAEYVEKQGAEPFIVAADAYFFWLCATSDYLDAQANSAPSDQPVEDEAAATSLLDMDLAIARHCHSTGIVEPDDIDDRMRLHLLILYQHINRTQGGPHHDAQTISR